eukprot:Clim_evm28s241 gene=Clim_evmTU28s241
MEGFQAFAEQNLRDYRMFLRTQEAAGMTFVERLNIAEIALAAVFGYFAIFTLIGLWNRYTRSLLYVSLPEVGRLEWCMATTRLIFSLVISALSVRIVGMQWTNLLDDPVRATVPMARFPLSLAAGFLLADAVARAAAFDFIVRSVEYGALRSNEDNDGKAVRRAELSKEITRNLFGMVGCLIAAYSDYFVLPATARLLGFITMGIEVLLWRSLQVPGAGPNNSTFYDESMGSGTHGRDDVDLYDEEEEDSYWEEENVDGGPGVGGPDRDDVDSGVAGSLRKLRKGGVGGPGTEGGDGTGAGSTEDVLDLGGTITVTTRMWAFLLFLSYICNNLFPSGILWLCLFMGYRPAPPAVVALCATVAGCLDMIVLTWFPGTVKLALFALQPGDAAMNFPEMDAGGTGGENLASDTRGSYGSIEENDPGESSSAQIRGPSSSVRRRGLGRRAPAAEIRRSGYKSAIIH